MLKGTLAFVESTQSSANWSNGRSENIQTNNQKQKTISTNMFTTSVAMHPDNDRNNNNNQLNEISVKIKECQRILIIMRGAPGSGKTTLATSLLRSCGLLDKLEASDFVFSTDDYFCTPDGFKFNSTVLSEAHDWNRTRVRDKAAAGWSPIIVDNTNTMIWEMQPYVKIAVQYGYVLELLEPQNNWRNSASKLAQKNVHQVPRETIQRMLERYEKASVQELLKLLKETKYTVPLPQLRLQPPLPDLQLTSISMASSAVNFKLNASAQAFMPYEQIAPIYWGQNQKPTNNWRIDSDKSLLELLRDEPAESRTRTEAIRDAKVLAQSNSFERHQLDCPNEAPDFVMLRQMYANKQLTGLWDLYVKCNGDVDWAVDILVKEDELNNLTNDSWKSLRDEEHKAIREYFQCDCSSGAGASANIRATTPTSSSSAAAAAVRKLSTPKPQRQPRTRRIIQPSQREVQTQIENCFVLSDEQYSDHMRKIRDLRNGIFEQLLPGDEDASCCIAIDVNEEDEAEGEDDENYDDTLLEIDLGDSLISQLRSMFKGEDTLSETLTAQQMATKVFMPSPLAKQLYMLWRESVDNQKEEQRQQTLRDDEQFARLLKNPKYAECNESPSNVNELLDMELAWSIYNSEQQAAQEAANQSQRQRAPNDIATHLTKMKLCDKFPDIPNDMVLEIFSATGNNYGKTVEVLDSNVKSDLTRDELFEQALLECEKLNKQVTQQQEQNKESSKLRDSSDTSKDGQGTWRCVVSKSPLTQEEAKNAALRDFEETRNMAAHHSQLKAECYLKAKQAVQKGNSGVAMYYSEIAQLHNKKIEMFNHRAANCIMEVHKHTQNNQDLLDLHYLHTVEAIACLDLFLDGHITMLRNTTRVYKLVFIITGRGLHSANGVSTIKNKVKARLRERRLRWQEVNPGLLRVKLFTASRYGHNF